MPFEVYEKMDGSLGISYMNQGIWYIATRGSFDSEQANHAIYSSCTKYYDARLNMQEGKTYLWEIIYPENRIVCDYGQADELVLLSIIDNKTGVETLENIGFPLVKKYDGINDYRKLKEIAEDNKEGFVVKFSNNFRVKVKFDEYVRLHRILTGVSNIAIWEYLKDGNSLDELLDRVPDEFYDYVKRTKQELENEFNLILDECMRLRRYNFNTQKEAAEYIKKQKHSSILFNMYNDKKYDHLIWKLIRPTFQKPFKQQTEC